MTLAAGRLKDLVRLERQEVSQDPVTGEVTTTWVTVAEHIPAEIVALSAREFIAAGATQAEVTARIKIRYRAGVIASMRMVDERMGTPYGLVGVLPDPNSGREYLTLPAKAGVSDGR